MSDTSVCDISDVPLFRELAVPKFVHDFAEGNKDLKDLLGGKGANLAEMTIRTIDPPLVAAVQEMETARRLTEHRARGQPGPRGPARPRDRSLRRARRRPGLRPLLPPGRPGQRVLLAVPRPGRPP